MANHAFIAAILVFPFAVWNSRIWTTMTNARIWLGHLSAQAALWTAHRRRAGQWIATRRTHVHYLLLHLNLLHLLLRYLKIKQAFFNYKRRARQLRQKIKRQLEKNDFGVGQANLKTNAKLFHCRAITILVFYSLCIQQIPENVVQFQTFSWIIKNSGTDCEFSKFSKKFCCSDFPHFL